jgi:hypothetical protein
VTAPAVNHGWKTSARRARARYAGVVAALAAPPSAVCPSGEVRDTPGARARRCTPAPPTPRSDAAVGPVRSTLSPCSRRSGRPTRMSRRPPTTRAEPARDAFPSAQRSGVTP